METIVITGGSGALGKSLAAAFSKTHRVIFTYNTRPVETDGCTAVQCDVLDRERVFALAETCDADILINNAGISQIKMFQDITPDEWRNMLDVHLTGAFNFTQAFLPYMLRQKKGCIINISSVWGRVGASCETHYSAAKAGLIGFTKALAKEVGLSGVRVNCIAPGVIESPMNSFIAPDDEIFGSVALGRAGTPADVARAALYLAEAEYVTGAVLRVDGGC